MKVNYHYLSTIVLTCIFSMGVLNVFGQKKDFAAKLKEAIAVVEHEADKDPDTFKANVARLEKEWGDRKDAVERSVVHAMLGSAYYEMKWTNITDFDEETRGDYDQRKVEHFAHVLDDMEALANAKADDYAVLLSKGKDSELYGNDMLSVMLSFAMRYAGWKDYECAELYEKAFRLYREQGNLNAYGAVKMDWLETKRDVPRKYGSLTEKQYRDSLYQLLLEVKDVEIGADVALAYVNFVDKEDERIPFLRWALENVANSRRKGELKGMLDELLCPRVELERTQNLLADRPSVVRVNYWNSDHVTLTVRQYAGRKQGKNRQNELILTGAVVEKHNVVCGEDSVNVERKAKNLPVKGEAKTTFTLPVGHYVLVAEGAGDRYVMDFNVTTLRLIEMKHSKDSRRIYVVDNETGRPLKGVKVQCRENLPAEKDRTPGWENRGLTEELVTGDDGMVEVKDGLWMRAVRNERDYTDYRQINRAWWYRDAEIEERVTLRVMTDRSLYRPGQTVMGSVIAYRSMGDEVKVVTDEHLTLRLRDSQGKELTTMELSTNEYGTASFDYTLPEDCAVGNLSLNVSSLDGTSGGERVKVEEYKRPTFDVTFDGKRSGKFGQTLEVVGTAKMLAGVPVQGATVHYEVECVPSSFRWWWYRNTDWETLDEGELLTDDEGQFRVPLFLTDEYVTEEYPLMRFRVTATVTDMSGESHEAEWTMNVSDREGVLEVKVDRVVDLAKEATFGVDVYDANHEKIEKDGRYQVKYGDDVVAEGTFAAGEKVLLPKNLRLGANYQLCATVMNKSGKEMTGKASFTPYSSALSVTNIQKMGTSEKRRPDGQPKEVDFIYAESPSEYVEGGTVDLYFSTAETDAYIIYNVYNVDGLLESRMAVTDGTMKHLRLQHKKEWGEGIEVKIVYVRNGHFAELSRRFTLAKPEKKLKLEWATFRDKLQPGQQEQWTLTVTDKNGRRVSGAEMMAVLYDAALDRIYSHDWSFGLSFPRRTPNINVSSMETSYFPVFWLKGKLPAANGYMRTFDALNGFEHDRYLRRTRNMLFSKGAVFQEVAVGAQRAEMLDEDGMSSSPVMAAPPMAVMEDAPNEEATGQENFENATVRENFAETAFFLPHLVSDKKGNVQIQFTLPESLTEWRFLGFAHTKEVDYGLIRATAKAQKAFMLRPNMPRFVRWGDEAVVASSVVNQSEEALKGAVRLRLLDAETEEVVLTQEKPFVVEAGKTVGVDFGFTVKEEWKDLVCELIAVSGNVSDGEKNPLPVLTTKKELVEAVPYYVMGNADGTEVTKTVNLSQLFNQNSKTATNRTLKVEYTDNPAWMCIEALRSVKNPEEDDAIDYAASFYANTRLVELMKTFPVMEKYEDANDLVQRATIAEHKLKGLQMADGGWSWFKGMKSSYYVTMAVCEHLARFSQPSDAVRKMLEEGLAYLDRHELEAYLTAKRYSTKIWPSNSELRYLYLSAQMPEREVSKDIQKMREEYLSLVEKVPRDLTIYGVANSAYALRAFGHTKAADKFVDFLKDYTVEKPGQGRFYATDAAYYSWMDYRIPTQIAAMKAIRQKDKKDGYLNDMQLWLIAQKQVQKWDNPMNTIDVADFLLQISPMETFHATQKPVLSVDGQVLQDLDYGTINTERDQLEGRAANLILQGNVLAEVPKEVLKEGVKQLEVKKATPSISWGAAYATFLEDIEHLNAYATDELKVQRKLYVQHAGSGEWEDYKNGQPLNVGDKLRIRHIITADRDMDFVRVSAQHPACLEPLRQLSGYQWMGGRGCYLSVHDSHFDMFFDWFTRGTSTLDMDYYVVREGLYEMGVSTVECAYAKQFGGHTKGLKVCVKSKK